MENFFFGQQILLAKNVVKGPAQYKFILAYWYHLFLVTKNIIKVYEEDVCDFIRFLQNLSLVIMRLFFSFTIFGKTPYFSAFDLKFISHKMFKNINCFGQNSVLLLY